MLNRWDPIAEDTEILDPVLTDRFGRLAEFDFSARKFPLAGQVDMSKWLGLIPSDSGCLVLDPYLSNLAVRCDVGSLLDLKAEVLNFMRGTMQVKYFPFSPNLFALGPSVSVVINV